MTIYESVLESMQEAEELGGPLGDAYMELMADIAREALTRMETYRAGSYHDDLKKEFQVVKKSLPLSFEEFRKTGRNVVFKDEPELAGCDIQSFMGRLYVSNCYIELLTDGRWYLVISNHDYIDASLLKLEQRLYEDHYILEHGS